MSVGERLNLIREDFMGMGIIQERDGGQLREFAIMLRCGAARHGSEIHTSNDRKLWRVFHQNCKLRREKKERESKKNQTKKQGLYI